MNYTYSDIAFTFQRHPSTKDVLGKYDEFAVRQALKHLMLTNPGEKPFDPNFGIGIQGMLFELSSPVTKIALMKAIKNKVAYYEPRVILDDVLIPDTDDNNSLVVSVMFHVIGMNNSSTLNISFDRVR